MNLDIKGTIIDDTEAWIYDFFEIPYCSPKKVSNTIANAKGEVLDVYINSGGGSVFAGSEIYTALTEYRNVKIHIVGLAGSIASVIAMAGDCEISPTAQIMIHNASANASGDYRSMNHASNMLDGISETIANAYVIKTGLPMEEIRKMMDSETWLTPTQAVEKGFADRVKTANSIKPQSVKAIAYSSIPLEIINKMQASRTQAYLELDFIKLKGEIKL